MFSAGGDIFLGGMHFEKDGGQAHPTVYTFDPTGEYPAVLKRSADSFSTVLYAENAIKFLNSKASKEKPFFCYVSFTSPHDPRTPPVEFEKMYSPSSIKLPPNYMPEHPFDNGDLKVRDEMLLPRPRTEDAIRKEIALYYGMVTEMDKQVGRIIKALEANGLRENTIIVFAGDNGLAVGQHGLLGKQNLYEHSIRVPMIITGPGIPKGSKYEGFNYLSDIAPTLYEYLRIPAPSTVEGKSLMSVFSDPSVILRPNIYNVYGHWSRSVKTSDGFKLILYNVDGVLHTQLFDLKHDPWEMKDHSSNPSYSKKIEDMRAMLKTEMAATHDDLNIDLPDWGRKEGQKGRGS
jgi:arylsulfatase A-like enzyme